MGQGPRRGVVGPVVFESVGDNAAAPGVEGLSSVALLALFFCFVIWKKKKVVNFCLGYCSLTTSLPDSKLG